MNQKWEWTKVYGLFAKKWHHFALEGSIHKSVNVSNTSLNYVCKTKYHDPIRST